jgi:uncharacterized protein
MINNQLSLILLPTNKCNVACEYCFEDKTADFMTHDQLTLTIEKLLDHMEQQQIAELIIYWQGGEVMIMQPEWFERAHELISNAASRRGKQIGHSLQSNMIGYSSKWNKIIAEMFGNSVGTSMDFPNLYRKARGHTAEEYTRLWTRNILNAREAGIQIGVISIPNQETLRLGGAAFYSYFVDELGITDFQINTSFSGGELNDAKTESILDLPALARLFVELADVWFERGYAAGVKLGPIDELLNHFLGRGASLPCIWQQNCADDFVSIDARGHVAQCDCWVTSYPEYRFGNVFGAQSFSQLMKESKARRRFVSRPEAMIEHETCAACDYLSLCHGGCPVRAYSITGEFFVKDPYCEVYKALFSRVEELATELSRARFVRSLPVLQTRGGPVNRGINYET